MFDKRPKNPLIVPVFISNQGCPHRCIFCHQETITGQSDPAFDIGTIKRNIDRAIKSDKFRLAGEREIAFYGGTFTKLALDEMAMFLKIVKPYLEKGLFQSVRVSTRPDAIDVERLELMHEFGVTTVELGAQAMNDSVLSLSHRGHKVADTLGAVEALKGYGFRIGLQLMPGLPGDSEDIFMSGIENVIKLRPDMVRLYPAVVIKGTGLAELYKAGLYKPLNLESAVRICRESCIRLEREGIPVIRIGLMSSPSLLEEGQIIAGPWHEAFGFLVRSSIHHQMIDSFLPMRGVAEKILLRVPNREIPLVRGHRNSGIDRIEELTGASVVKVVADDAVPLGTVEVEI